jgi:radical SAM superfamily enzyme YgiQ (UPF0313 family)
MVTVSGSDATAHLTEYFSSGADFIIMGEGEIMSGELVDQLKESGNQKSRISTPLEDWHSRILTALSVVLLRANSFENSTLYHFPHGSWLTWSSIEKSGASGTVCFDESRHDMQMSASLQLVRQAHLWSTQ